MSTDFRPSGIITLSNAVKNSIAGLRAMRAGGGVSYALDRLVATEASLGSAFQVVDSADVSAKVDRENATPTRYYGDSTDGTGGTAAFAIASLSLKQRYSSKLLYGAVVTATLGVGGPGYVAGEVLNVVQAANSTCRIRIDTVNAGAVVTFTVVHAGVNYTVANGLASTGGSGADATFNVTVVDRTLAANLTYASGYALASGEIYKVKVDGVLKTVTTDYTVSSQNIVFEAAHEPGNGSIVEIFALSSATPLTDEVVTVSVDGTIQTLTTHYTITDGIVTFEATFVPLAGEQIAIWFRIPGTRAYTLASAAGSDVRSVGAGVIKVYVATVLKTLTTDYTVADGIVTFNADKIPADGAAVEFRWEYAQHDVFNAAGLTPIATGETAIVHKDAGVETLTTNYVITSGGKVTFQAGHYPAVGAVITIDYFTANAVVVAGGIIFFDTNHINLPAWTHIVPTTAAIVEIM
jgi:hypothetical protein